MSFNLHRLVFFFNNILTLIFFETKYLTRLDATNPEAPVINIGCIILLLIFTDIRCIYDYYINYK